MACDQNKWTISQGEIDSADVVALLEYHFAEMRAGSPPEACHVLPIEGLRDPSIRLISLRDPNGRLLGIGALKTIGPGHGELKSMRTDRNALGKGAGRAILGHLMSLAREAGVTRLSCETGSTVLFAAANRLYETSGFERCGPFGNYRETEFTHFYTREI